MTSVHLTRDELVELTGLRADNMPTEWEYGFWPVAIDPIIDLIIEYSDVLTDEDAVLLMGIAAFGLNQAIRDESAAIEAAEALRRAGGVA